MATDLVEAPKKPRQLGNAFVERLAGIIPEPVKFKKEGTSTLIEFGFLDGNINLMPEAFELSAKIFKSSSWNETLGPVGRTFTTMNGDVVDLNVNGVELKGEKALTFLALRTWTAVADVKINAKSKIALEDKTSNGKPYKDISSEDDYTFKFVLADRVNFEKYNGFGDNSGHGHTWFDDRGRYREGVTFPNDELDPAWGVFNNSSSGWPSKGPVVGSEGFDTLLHEIGHMFGFYHPDDSEYLLQPMGSWSANMNAYSTIMNQSGSSDPHSMVPRAGLGAVDIAAMQAIYGKNNRYHAENDVYKLPTNMISNQVSADKVTSATDNNVGWMCLWDAGGTADKITIGPGSYVSATIDLRSATLKDEEGGGGWRSYVDGINAGFTIAWGAKIENATGGVGKDRLQGNQYANILEGDGGDDTLIGAGDADILSGGSGRDIFVFQGIGDFMKVDGVCVSDTINDFKAGEDRLDFRRFKGSDGKNIAPFVFLENNASFQRNGTAQLAFNTGARTLFGDMNGDGTSDFSIQIKGLGSLTRNDFILA